MSSLVIESVLASKKSSQILLQSLSRAALFAITPGVDERIGTMRTQLTFANFSGIETELLAVLATDTQTGKGRTPNRSRYC